MREVKRSVEQVSVRALLELRTRMGEPRSRMGASPKQPFTSLEAAAKAVFCALALVEEDTAEGLALARGKLSKHSWERVLRALAVPGDFLNLLRRLPASMDGRWTERVEFIRHVLATPETSPMTVETQLRRWFEALLTLGESPLATDPSPECKRSLQDALEAVQTSLAKPAVSETEVKDQTEKLDVQEVRMRPTPQKAVRSPLRDTEGRRAGKSRQTPGPKGEDIRRVSSPGGVSQEPRFVGSEGSRRRSDPAPKPVKGEGAKQHRVKNKKGREHGKQDASTSREQENDLETHHDGGRHAEVEHAVDECVERDVHVRGSCPAGEAPDGQTPVLGPEQEACSELHEDSLLTSVQPRTELVEPRVSLEQHFDADETCATSNRGEGSVTAYASADSTRSGQDDTVETREGKHTPMTEVVQGLEELVVKDRSVEPTDAKHDSAQDEVQELAAAQSLQHLNLETVPDYNLDPEASDLGFKALLDMAEQRKLVLLELEAVAGDGVEEDDIDEKIPQDPSDSSEESVAAVVRSDTIQEHVEGPPGEVMTEEDFGKGEMRHPMLHVHGVQEEVVSSLEPIPAVATECGAVTVSEKVERCDCQPDQQSEDELQTKDDGEILREIPSQDEVEELDVHNTLMNRLEGVTHSLAEDAHQLDLAQETASETLHVVDDARQVEAARFTGLSDGDERESHLGLLEEYRSSGEDPTMPDVDDLARYDSAQKTAEDIESDLSCKIHAEDSTLPPWSEPPIEKQFSGFHQEPVSSECCEESPSRVAIPTEPLMARPDFSAPTLFPEAHQSSDVVQASVVENKENEDTTTPIVQLCADIGLDETSETCGHENKDNLELQGENLDSKTHVDDDRDAERVQAANMDCLLEEDGVDRVHDGTLKTCDPENEDDLELQEEILGSEAHLDGDRDAERADVSDEIQCEDVPPEASQTTLVEQATSMDCVLEEDSVLYAHDVTKETCDPENKDDLALQEEMLESEAHLYGDRDAERVNVSDEIQCEDVTQGASQTTPVEEATSMDSVLEEISVDRAQDGTSETCYPENKDNLELQDVGDNVEGEDCPQDSTPKHCGQAENAHCVLEEDGVDRAHDGTLETRDPGNTGDFLLQEEMQESEQEASETTPVEQATRTDCVLKEDNTCAGLQEEIIGSEAHQDGDRDAERVDVSDEIQGDDVPQEASRTAPFEQATSLDCTLEEDGGNDAFSETVETCALENSLELEIHDLILASETLAGDGGELADDDKGHCVGDCVMPDIVFGDKEACSVVRVEAEKQIAKECEADDVQPDADASEHVPVAQEPPHVLPEVMQQVPQESAPRGVTLDLGFFGAASETHADELNDESQTPKSTEAEKGTPDAWNVQADTGTLKPTETDDSLTSPPAACEPEGRPHQDHGQLLRVHVGRPVGHVDNWVVDEGESVKFVTQIAGTNTMLDAPLLHVDGCDCQELEDGTRSLVTPSSGEPGRMHVAEDSMVGATTVRCQRSGGGILWTCVATLVVAVAMFYCAAEVAFSLGPEPEVFQ